MKNYLNDLLSELNEITEDDVEKYNTDKLVKILVKIYRVLLYKINRHHIIDMVKLDKLDSYLGKSEESFMTEFENLTTAQRLKFFKILIDKKQNEVKNDNKFRSSVPDRLDQASKLKLSANESQKIEPSEQDKEIFARLEEIALKEIRREKLKKEEEKPKEDR